MFPNIPKTVGMIYQTFETGLKMLISTLPKLVSVNGNSEAFGKIHIIAIYIYIYCFFDKCDANNADF